MADTGRNKKSRRRELRIRRIILPCAAAVLLAAIILGAAAVMRSCRISGAKRSLPFSADGEYCYTGGGFLYTGEQKLHYLSLADESKSFSSDADVLNAHVAGGEQVKVIYNASTVQFIGTPYEHTFEGAVLKVVCGDRYVGVYTENADNSHSLTVYNSAGDRLIKRDFDDSVLLDFGFERGGSAMYVSELVISGSAVSTTVTTFDLSRESITGVLNVQGEAVKRVIMTEKSVFTFGTDSLIRYNRADNTEAYRLLMRGCEYVDSSTEKGRLYLLVSIGEESESASPLRMISMREGESADERVLELAADADAVSTFTMHGRAVAVKEDGIVIRDISGAVSARLSHGVKADGAVKLDGESLIITSAERAVLYTLKNF